MGCKYGCCPETLCRDVMQVTHKWIHHAFREPSIERRPSASTKSDLGEPRGLAMSFEGMGEDNHQVENTKQ